MARTLKNVNRDTLLLPIRVKGNGKRNHNPLPPKPIYHITGLFPCQEDFAMVKIILI